jgi:AcrR family transcriptional regulator
MRTDSAPRTAREIARSELTRSIITSAREQLAQVGPAALSLRAVARELNMASSAVYRYFANRDELLTALISAAYDDLGAAAEAADRKAAGRKNFGARWLAFAQAVRTWALAHPHDYALIYGSPVPGYGAPQSTIEPAGRVVRVLLDLLLDIQRAGQSPPAGSVPRPAHRALAGLKQFVGEPIGDDLALRGLAAWGGLLGAISLELFGHLTGAIDDYDAYFDQVARRLAVVD